MCGLNNEIPIILFYYVPIKLFVEIYYLTEITCQPNLP